MDTMKEKIEKAEKQHEAFGMFFDLLAQSGEPRFIYNKKLFDFREKLSNLTTDEKVTNEQFEKLNNLIDQFTKLVDDILKEDNQ